MRTKLKYMGKNDPLIDTAGLIREQRMSTPGSAVYVLNENARISLKYEGRTLTHVVIVTKNKKDNGNLLNRCYQGKFDNWGLAA